MICLGEFLLCFCLLDALCVFCICVGVSFLNLGKIWFMPLTLDSSCSSMPVIQKLFFFHVVPHFLNVLFCIFFHTFCLCGLISLLYLWGLIFCLLFDPLSWVSNWVIEFFQFNLSSLQCSYLYWVQSSAPGLLWSFHPTLQLCFLEHHSGVLWIHSLQVRWVVCVFFKFLQVFDEVYGCSCNICVL